MPTLKEVVSVLLVVAVVIGGFFIYMRISDLRLKRKLEEDEESDEGKGEKVKETIESIANYVFYGLLVLLGTMFIYSILWKDWPALGIVVVVSAIVAYYSYDVIANVHVGLPSSLFLGRFFSENDKYDCSVPIREPALEGFVLKKPWHKFDQISRDNKVINIPSRKYQTKAGSIILRGRINVRVSPLATYRAAELTIEESSDMLLSNIHKIIIAKIIPLTLDNALKSKETLEVAILEVMKSPAIIKADPAGDITRKLWDRDVSYAEHQFGLEVLSVFIDDIDPTEEIQKRRDAIVSETLKLKQRRIQLKATDEVKKKYPDLDDSQVLAAVQILDADVPATREIKTIEVAEMDKAISLIRQIASALKSAGGGGS